MAFTLELSQKHSGALRRIAWATGQPMARTLESILEWLGKELDKTPICKSCRDKSFCVECVFRTIH